MINARNGRMAARAMALLLASVAAPALANTVSGTVVDNSGVRPLQGAEVRIDTLGRVTQADAEGRFRFTNLPAGTYTVSVSFTGAAAQSQDVAVVDGAARGSWPSRLLPKVLRNR
jgi:hypothetical protein